MNLDSVKTQRPQRVGAGVNDTTPKSLWSARAWNLWNIHNLVTSQDIEVDDDTQANDRQEFVELLERSGTS